MKNDKKKGDTVKPTSIGGQAVMEGVMMRGKNGYVVAVRHPQNGIVTAKHAATADRRFPFLKWPLIRGVVSFVQSLVTGMKVISESAELSGMDDLTEENPSKFDLWLERKFGDKLTEIIMGISVVLAIALGIGLFILLPTFLTSLLSPLYGESHIWRSVIEGVTRIGIFVLYIFLISRMKEVRRLFGYHGAEHKSIACFEHGEELTVENARKYPRLHKRCGTSFLLIVMIISMIVFFFVKTDVFWLRILSRLLLVPVIAGLSYEALRLAGRHDNVLITILSWPGLMLQKLTTSEPDDSQIEVALAALKGVLADEEPEAAACPEA